MYVCSWEKTCSSSLKWKPITNLFENLLKLSEEEFGFSYDGALRIACARLMSFSFFFAPQDRQSLRSLHAAS
ncbi:hypothetical protein CUMW_118720 [Citrus unshiu]|nr:hypothetical protein CUMW_118720 [Citrus unshiu]